MKDFDYEVMERKRLANQARHRKNGSRSKKCSLPSDGMSHKEWKERNGEIVSVRMNRPMSWEDFKKLSKDSKQLYICTLQELYDASLTDFGTLFGITCNGVRQYLKRAGITIKADKHRRSAAQKEAWERFCNGETTPPQATDGARPKKEETPSCNLTPCKSGEQEPAEPPRKSSMLLDRFTLQFSGEFDPDAVRNSLAMILQKGQQVKIEISCTVEG